ncbi:MAG: LLM class flavin-dependent oxidoreductase, partial [Candidatus Nitrosocosmicus sp.]
TELGKERGWHKVTRTAFDAQRGTYGALLVGDPEEIVEKIARHSKDLGGDISRFTFMMNAASLPHEKLIQAIKLIGTRVAPALRKEIG